MKTYTTSSYSETKKKSSKKQERKNAAPLSKEGAEKNSFSIT